MDGPAKILVAATWIGILVNILLALTKAVVGVTAGSQALLADAAHSASDIVGSLIALIAIRLASKPPDPEHPYGHGKAEHVASIIVGMLLMAVGVQLAASSGRILAGGAPEPPGLLALPIMAGDIVAKELLFQWKMRLGRRFKSAAMAAEAWHHRSDTYSSVAALVGIAAAAAGRRLGVDLLLYGDAAAGVVVSLLIVQVGFSLMKQSSSVVLENVLSEAETQPFIRTAAGVAGVTRVDRVLVRSHGRYVIIDITIGVDPKISVEAGHAIGCRVRQALLAAHPEVRDVFVQVNP